MFFRHKLRLQDSGFPHQRPCPLYKLESGGQTHYRVLTWKVLRWVLIPVTILLALALLVLFSVERSDSGSSESHSLVIVQGNHSDAGNNGTLKIEQEILEVLPELDIEISETLVESTEEEEDFDTSESKPATLTNRRISTHRPYVQASTTLRTSGIQVGDKHFVDKLISSFDHSARGRPMGLLNKKLPNGHKYGEYQMPVTKDASTAAPRVSPTLPSSNPTVHIGNQRNETENVCLSPRLSLCRGVLPWDLTGAAVIPGISSTLDLDAVMPYFDMISSTGCSPRIRQFLCPLLEPECRNAGYNIVPPCKKTCRAVEEECREFILDSLDLSQVFNCDIYPDSDNHEECVNLAKGEKCLKHEFQCSDGTCIPWRWVCDSARDCALGEDETNCTVCTTEEFRCAADYKCLPLEWKCDRRKDCSDGSDEFNCHTTEVLMPHSHTSPCPSGELRCVDGRCITIHQICDNVNDCSDRADEANCSLPLT